MPGPSQAHVLIRLVHRGLTLNDIQLRQAGIRYLTLSDISSGYHSLKLDEQSSHLTAFSHLFGRNRYITLQFWVTPAGDIFQRKMYELFQGLPNVFDSTDNILIVGFTELDRDNYETVVKVLAICRKVSLKLNKAKCLRCTSIPFFGEVISQNGVSPDPKKVQVLMDIPPHKYKKELVSFLGMINYLRKISTSSC